MANIRKLSYFKPVKPNSRDWYLKRRARPREGKSGKGNVNGETMGKRIGPA